MVEPLTGSQSSPPQLSATQTGTWYYFGRKMIKNASGYVVADRLGSIGHFYPYGQEKPSATTNGTEKFTGYLRDAETAMDYAINRYHVPGTGRFLTPDRFLGSARITSPGTWNRYTYVNGDPINRTDKTGLDDICDGTDDDDLKDCDIGAGDDGGDGGDGGMYGGGGGDDGGCWIDDFEPNPECYDPAPPQNPNPSPPAQPQPTCEDQLDSSISDFLTAKNSPLANYSDDLVTDAQNAGLNPWLLVAISYGESTYGTSSAAQKTANAFGLLHRAGKQYVLYSYNGDWNAGIVAAAKTVDSQFVNGNVTVQQMFERLARRLLPRRLHE